MLYILLYGSETWKGLKEIENRLRIFESNCPRIIMNIKLYEHITEEEWPAECGAEVKTPKVEVLRACAENGR